VPTVISPRTMRYAPTLTATIRAAAAAIPCPAILRASTRVPRRTISFASCTPSRNPRASTRSIANPFTVRIPASTSLKRP